MKPSWVELISYQAQSILTTEAPRLRTLICEDLKEGLIAYTQDEVPIRIFRDAEEGSWWAWLPQPRFSEHVLEFYTGNGNPLLEGRTLVFREEDRALTPEEVEFLAILDPDDKVTFGGANAWQRVNFRHGWERSRAQRLRTEDIIEGMASGRYKLLLKFPCLYQGWECDPEGYVILDPENRIRLVLTSHGAPYWADTEQLETTLETYRTAVRQTEEALNLLKGSP